jgi:GIY-YIG catalytic domain
VQRKTNRIERPTAPHLPRRVARDARLPFAIANRKPTFASSFVRGHSSVGRAPALQAGSQGFESPCLQSTLAAAAESVDCRDGALAKADSFNLATPTQRASTRQAIMGAFTYVYILQSETYPDRFYVGQTQDLRTRLVQHNAGRFRGLLQGF